MPHYPSSELVAVAWAKALPGVDPSKVATSLPADPAVWGATGFVTVTVVGGGSDMDNPLFEPVVSFDCWANAANSNRAPWGQAGALAAAVQWGTYGRAPFTVAMPDGFHTARLLSVYALAVPRRVPSDAAGFARVQLDVSMAWTVSAAVAA